MKIYLLYYCCLHETCQICVNVVVTNYTFYWDYEYHDIVCIYCPYP
jgi:hypothetical protein